MGDNFFSKNGLRKISRNAVSSLGDDVKRDKSFLIQQKFIGSDFFSCDIFLSYFAMPSEVDTALLNEKILSDGKKLFLPRTHLDSYFMDFFEIDGNRNIFEQVEKNNFGIYEPFVNEAAFDANNFLGKRICVIVPCVAFDRERNRLGHGKGYYDYFISVLKKNFCGKAELSFCGFAFDEQIFNYISVSDNDEKVDCIFTDEEILV